MDKPPLKKRISHVFEYAFTRFLGISVYPIPFGWLNTVSAILVFILSPFVPQASRRIRDNLKHAFPDMSEKEREKLIKKNLVHTVRVFLEVFQVYKFRKKHVAEKYLSYKDDYALEVLAGRDKGVVVIQGHFGNWELPIKWYAHHDVPVPFVLKRQSNPIVDKYMLDVRRGYGATPYYMEDSMGILKELKSGSVIGLVCDQDAGPGGQFAEFFGRQASCFPGPALMSFMQGTKLLLCYNVYKGKGKYEVGMKEICPEVQKSDFANSKDALAKLTQLWCNALEEQIRTAPEQYFWIHRRWKSQPQTEQDAT